MYTARSKTQSMYPCPEFAALILKFVLSREMWHTPGHDF